MAPPFLPLLQHLSSLAQPCDGVFQDWSYTRILGGRNNLLYHVAGLGQDLAVKFTIRDRRDRAGREYQALRALQQAGLDIAPKPLYYHLHRFPQPVVVMTWLEGECSNQPPVADSDWESLLEHLVSIFSVRPDKSGVCLRKAVLDARSGRDCLTIVRQQTRLVPNEQQPPALRALLQRFETWSFPKWAPPPLSLCRVDANIQNFIRRPGGWASVDWENSGWGDPAFEIADLLTHAAYLSVPPERWDWVIQRYCQMVDDPSAFQRIQAYRGAQLVWWAVRTVRYLLEIPQGKDARLVAFPAGWQANMQAMHARYLNLASEFYT